jgi:hypothetical protein
LNQTKRIVDQYDMADALAELTADLGTLLEATSQLHLRVARVGWKVDNMAVAKPGSPGAIDLPTPHEDWAERALRHQGDRAQFLPSDGGEET